MLTEFAGSFKENIFQKTKNPFLGTFIIVWIVKNWRFVFTFFNFDKNSTLNDRIKLLETFSNSYSILENLGTCALISIVILIITYFLLSLSRLVINFFEKIVSPQVYKLTDKSSIILKVDHTKLRNAYLKLESKLEEERETKTRLQADYENLERKISEIIQAKTMGEKQDKINQPVVNPGAEETKADLLLIKLKGLGLLQEFLTVGGNILNEISFKKDRNSSVFTFTRLGLVEPVEHEGDGYYSYKFTSIGRKVYDLAILDSF
jgi:hypothetical protein